MCRALIKKQERIGLPCAVVLAATSDVFLSGFAKAEAIPSLVCGAAHSLGIAASPFAYPKRTNANAGYRAANR
jgi:hypothetical protein